MNQMKPGLQFALLALTQSRNNLRKHNLRKFYNLIKKTMQLQFKKGK